MRRETGVGASGTGVCCAHCGTYNDDPWDDSPEGFCADEYGQMYHDECLDKVLEQEAKDNSNEN